MNIFGIVLKRFIRSACSKLTVFNTDTLLKLIICCSSTVFLMLIYYTLVLSFSLSNCSNKNGNEK